MKTLSWQDLHCDILVSQNSYLELNLMNFEGIIIFFFCCSELNYLSTLYPFYLFLRISRISSLVFHVLSNFENIRQFTNTIQLISSNFRVAMVFYIIGTKFFILEMHKKIEITIKILVQALFGLLWCFSILGEI